MEGLILDFSTTDAVEDVSIVNIHASTTILSHHDGKFSIEASPGDLIEFRKDGYKTIRVRVPEGKQPFYRVAMDKIAPRSAPSQSNPLHYAREYKADSEKYYALYKKALEFPKLSGLDLIRHPFSALSQKNREVWEFQKEFSWFQQQKFIDYAFNERVIKAITGLEGDSVNTYIRMFRPSYDQLTNMNEYSYFVYLKKTVEAYRERGIRARMPNVRGTR